MYYTIKLRVWLTGTFRTFVNRSSKKKKKRYQYLKKKKFDTTIIENIKIVKKLLARFFVFP